MIVQTHAGHVPQVAAPRPSGALPVRAGAARGLVQSAPGARGYSAKHAADEIQAALRRAGKALAADEDGPQSAFCQDNITTEPSPS